MSTQNPSKWAARAAVLGLAVTALVACGGGDDESTRPSAPTSVTVSAPLSPPSAGSSSGTTASGTLNYLVYGSADVATETGGTASAQIAVVPTPSSFSTTITFPASAAPFATGLVINDAHSGGPTWPTDVSSLRGGGVADPSFPSGTGTGLLTQGNFFVFCSNGPAAPAITEQTARSGAQVAISGHFVPMGNVAALYGQKFQRFDCAGTAATTTFGDGQGHLTMAFDGMTLTEAQTVQAFSAAGYAPAAGQIIKRRAYSIVVNGRTRYAIVALDNRGYAYASVLYQME